MPIDPGNSAFSGGNIPTKQLAADASFETTDPRTSDVPAMGDATDDAKSDYKAASTTARQERNVQNRVNLTGREPSSLERSGPSTKRGAPAVHKILRGIKTTGTSQD